MRPCLLRVLTVNVPRLLHILSRLDHRRRLYLGDFSTNLDGEATAYRSCDDGARAVLSRGAAMRTDFGSCAKHFNSSCEQAHRMIGRCLASSDVMAYTGVSRAAAIRTTPGQQTVALCSLHSAQSTHHWQVWRLWRLC